MNDARHHSQPITASERDQIAARLSDLQAKQEAATGWGAAVGAREEEIRSLESRLLRIDSMTAPPSTETPRHTATPWVIPAGKGNECVICEGDDPYKPGWIVLVVRGPLGTSEVYGPEFLAEQAASIVSHHNSHASLTARVAELTEALRPFAGDKLPSARRTEIAFDRHGLRRCISPLELARDRAFAALDNADGGRG